MINIDKVTTKTGDNGKTLGPGFKKISKYSSEISFLGSLDELNASIGECIFFNNNKKIKKILEKIQHQIFDIGAAFFKQIDIENEKIKFLENNIKELNEKLPALTSFLIPSGSIDIIKLHISRTITRKSESLFWGTNNSTKNIGIYLNRLSDLLFVLLRKNSKKTWNNK